MKEKFIKFSEAFNIHKDLKHDHSSEEFKRLQDCIAKLDVLLGGMNSHFVDHDSHFVDHVLKYSELNIKFFFMADFLPDKTMLRDAMNLYIENMVNLFMIKESMINEKN